MVKVFGTTGEEQLVGKSYMVKAGVYDGLDAFLDWHPFGSTLAFWNTTSALASATFTFLGAAGHGATPRWATRAAWTAPCSWRRCRSTCGRRTSHRPAGSTTP
jgi:metal-dependent amidase/aminoacylase/carboxypeptidase family protein